MEVLIIDPFTLKLLRKSDDEVICEVSETSSVPLDEVLDYLDRISGLWNTFCGVDEPATLLRELLEALEDAQSALRFAAKHLPPQAAISVAGDADRAAAAIAKAKGEDA